MNTFYNYFSDFYSKNIFERIVVYVFASVLITKLVFELILGEWSFVQSQNKQWIFYSFLAIDYIISYRKVMNIRVSVNPMSLLAVVFLIMCIFGLYVGLTNHNRPFEILNDFIPLFMIALNILRMQSYEETSKPIDFDFLLKIAVYLGFLSCLVGTMAQLLGKPSGPTLGESAIFIPIFFTAIFRRAPFPKTLAILSFIMIALTLPNFNRTLLAFCALTLSTYLLFRVIRNPLHGLLSLILMLLLISSAWLLVPENSKVYQRIAGLQDINLSDRSGSIGERQAEWDAINAKLNRLGDSGQWFGLGFGGLYDVKITHEYKEDYGHAHFSWAWFKLRFGNVGYLFLGIMTSALIYNIIIGFKTHHYTRNLLVALICLQGILYCLTYVNSIFLLSGIHFLQLRTDAKVKKNIHKLSPNNTSASYGENLPQPDSGAKVNSPKRMFFPNEYKSTLTKSRLSESISA